MISAQILSIPETIAMRDGVSVEEWNCSCGHGFMVRVMPNESDPIERTCPNCKSILVDY